MPRSTHILRRLEKDGNSRAWGSFFKHYSQLVQGVAARLGMSAADQDEIVQETMIAAHRNLKPKGMTGPQARAWLRCVTRRKIIDLLRKSYRRGEQVPYDDLIAHPENTEAMVDHVWDEEWQTSLLAQALDRLRSKVAPKMYQAFDLFVLREHSAEEVAKLLGINRSLVYLYKLRVTERLRKEIHQIGKELSL
jgi:RNA polymerase sigma factor (sigma-70 family)